jgi:hypothetical protein
MEALNTTFFGQSLVTGYVFLIFGKANIKNFRHRVRVLRRFRISPDPNHVFSFRGLGLRFEDLFSTKIYGSLM